MPTTTTRQRLLSPTLSLLLLLLLVPLLASTGANAFGFGGGSGKKDKEKEAAAAAAPNQRARKAPVGPPPQVEILTGTFFWRCGVLLDGCWIALRGLIGAR